MMDIHHVIGAYCQALDDGRTDDLLALFCADATVRLPGLDVLSGQDALRTGYAGMKPRRPQRHVASNTVVTLVDDDTATATSDVLVLGKGDAGWTVFLVGRYQDELRRTGSAWRFASRRLDLV
jgi:3-phenylpropionate/cinnamic acid dioxygenase small subunit